MIMGPESIRRFFDYSYWAYELIWGCIEQLTDDQFTQPIDYSTGSIRNHMVHVMSATHRWMARIESAKTPSHLIFEDFKTRRVVRTRWNELRLNTMRYLESLTADHLDEIVSWELLNRGLAARNHRWEILLHVANHATEHRSQILTMLNTRFGVETPEQDMIFYLLENQDDDT